MGLGIKFFCLGLRGHVLVDVRGPKVQEDVEEEANVYADLATLGPALILNRVLMARVRMC